MSVARLLSWSAPATISLAEALEAVDQAHDPKVRGGGDAIGQGVRRDLVTRGVLLPEDHARADELAGHLAGRGHVSAQVAAQIEDELRPAGLDVRRQIGRHLVGGAVREVVHPDVPDGVRRRANR